MPQITTERSIIYLVGSIIFSTAGHYPETNLLVKSVTDPYSADLTVATPLDLRWSNNYMAYFPVALNLLKISYDLFCSEVFMSYRVVVCQAMP